MEKKWYALYTKSRHEKKVKEWLELNNYEVYLPLQKTLKQWSDRKKWVSEPVIKGYIFVKSIEHLLSKVLFAPGAVNFVKLGNKYATIPNNQMVQLKLFIEERIPISAGKYQFAKGESVKITFGKFKGFKGKLIEIRGNKKVVMELASINQTLLLEIPREYLKHLKTFS